MLTRFALAHPCTLCRQKTTHRSTLCAYCWQLVVPLSSYALCSCALPIWATSKQCANCQQQAPYYHQARCGYRYNYPLDKLINHYKHQRNITVEACLKELWLAHVSAITTQPEVLVPIPLHWRRRYWRGFNQSHRLAWFAHQHTHLPIATLLQKNKATAAQQRRTKQQRHQALQGVFSCSFTRLPYRHIALIDDVLTTGSTANEAARVLLQHGAQRVDVWALARAF